MESAKHKVSDLLNDRKCWIQNASAKDSEGNIVEPGSDSAVCWCLWGAITACYGWERFGVAEKIYKVLGSITITKWNDSHTFDDVRALVTSLDI